MKKSITAGVLLLVLFSVALSGCGNNVAEETENNISDTITTSSGNVLAEPAESLQVLQTTFLGNTKCDRTTIQTVTFLDSLDDMPSDAWDASEAGDGSAMAWLVLKDNDMYDLYIAGNGGVDANSSSAQFFAYFTNLETINFNDCFCTSSVRSMQSFFLDCEKLTSLDLSCFDTSRVKNMASMFSGCKSLTELDLSSFDTSKVTSMSLMFNDCESLTNVDISHFDMSNVDTKANMFLNCPAGG